jgi:multidrug efflux pump subunit AcrB
LLPVLTLTPIPLTRIGIMFGHWLFGAPFGFVALAGIIVSSAILLVDFIRRGAGEGKKLREAL